MSSELLDEPPEPEGGDRTLGRAEGNVSFRDVGFVYTAEKGAVLEDIAARFLAAEDEGFYEHAGLDYFGILRAAIKNLRPGAHLQGASTITQQTVKTMVLGPERSYTRKMREAISSNSLNGRARRAAEHRDRAEGP